MSERFSLNYEPSKIPEGTRFDDGAEVALQMSKLGTPDEGRVVAEVTHATEVARHPELERRPVYGHEQAVISTQYVMGVRNAELAGSDTLVLKREDLDLAA